MSVEIYSKNFTKRYIFNQKLSKSTNKIIIYNPNNPKADADLMPYLNDLFTSETREEGVQA